MLRIREAVKAVILVLAVAGVSILSCSSELAVTGSGHGASRDDIAIEGYVIAPDHTPISGVTVTWKCTSHPTWQTLDSDKTDGTGYYAIPDTNIGTTHDGHTFRGEVYYAPYGWKYEWIYGYDSDSIPYYVEFRY
jgi:hypothetical protein